MKKALFSKIITWHNCLIEYEQRQKSIFVQRQVDGCKKKSELSPEKQTKKEEKK